MAKRLLEIPPPPAPAFAAMPAGRLQQQPVNMRRIAGAAAVPVLPPIARPIPEIGRRAVMPVAKSHDAGAMGHLTIDGKPRRPSPEAAVVRVTGKTTPIGPNAMQPSFTGTTAYQPVMKGGLLSVKAPSAASKAKPAPEPVEEPAHRPDIAAALVRDIDNMGTVNPEVRLYRANLATAAATEPRTRSTYGHIDDQGKPRHDTGAGAVRVVSRPSNASMVRIEAPPPSNLPAEAPIFGHMKSEPARNYQPRPERVNDKAQSAADLHSQYMAGNSLPGRRA
jgi:hypothetical protein